MLVIKLNARNQRLNRYTSAVVVPNSYNDLKLQFNFLTEDWQTVTKKIANFSYKSYSASVEVDENNLCTVPANIVRPPCFYVSVDGFIDDDSIVTNKVKILVNPNKETGDCNCGPNIVYVPDIDERKILSWTIQEVTDDMPSIPPTDLNPYDEWIDDETESEYIWEEE